VGQQKKFMLATTFQIVKCGLQADPSLTPADRTRLMAILRNGANADKPETTTERVARIIQRRETARRLGNRSLRFVDRLEEEGILKKVRLPGRKRAVGFREEDVNRLIAAS
jgi:hypothetical protein